MSILCIRHAGRNLQHISHAEVLSGYAAPASFDITAVIRPGQNHITVLCVRLQQNELGTGGLLGPVVVYRER